jgi:lysophospholipase L1-like esterase
MQLLRAVLVQTVSACIYVAFSSAIASACPQVSGLPDYNCDGRFIISFFGDSILRGRTDPLFQGHNGSVPLRLIKQLEQSMPSGRFKVLNFSVPGNTCQAGHSRFRAAIERNELGVAASDVAVFSCGINDYLHFQSPEAAFARIRSLRRAADRAGVFGLVANVSRTRIGPLQSWIDRLNEKIKQLGGYIRFDRLNPRTMLTADGIHPNGSGFAFMTDTFYRFLTNARFVSLGEGQLGLTDSDGDKLYDRYEESVFGTLPTSSDTDGDGIDDGTEVVNGTDPTIFN